MTWWLLGGLAAGCYFFKITGVLAAGSFRLSGAGQSFLAGLSGDARARVASLAQLAGPALQDRIEKLAR